MHQNTLNFPIWFILQKKYVWPSKYQITANFDIILKKMQHFHIFFRFKTDVF